MTEVGTHQLEPAVSGSPDSGADNVGGGRSCDHVGEDPRPAILKRASDMNKGFSQRCEQVNFEGGLTASMRASIRVELLIITISVAFEAAVTNPAGLGRRL